MYFVDSEGGLWATCHADHIMAQAFGPEGTAYPVSWSYVGYANHTAASTAGDIDESGEWPVLRPHRCRSHVYVGTDWLNGECFLRVCLVQESQQGNQPLSGYYHRSKLAKAVAYARQHGAPYSGVTQSAYDLVSTVA